MTAKMQGAPSESLESRSLNLYGFVADLMV